MSEAAYSDMNNQAWVIDILRRLFLDDASVKRELKRNPFSEKAPNYLRIKRYTYTFENSTTEG